MPHFNYTFQVAHEGRPDDPAIITLGGQHTLADLHDAIQDAFDFDADHLYSFFMSGRLWDRTSEYAAVRSSSLHEKLAGKTKIRDLGLTVGQTFLYLFDYGDEHLFAVRVERITPVSRALPEADIERLPSVPPHQYRGWEAEEGFGDEAIEDPEADDLEYPWGGDGTDLMKPVRAHVEAALVPTDAPYPLPVDQLLHLGDARNRDIRDRVAALGLTQAHVPDLVRMARDRTLNTEWTETDQDWAPILAMIALEGLDVSAFVSDLIPLFDVESDWYSTSLSRTLSRAGAEALEPLTAYIHDRTRWVWGRAVVAETMAEIGQQHPELRDTVVQILTAELEHAKENDPTVNGSVLAGLLDLDAVEALPVIRAAMEKDFIDEAVAGDWQEVLNELGHEADPDDPLLKKPAFRPSWPLGFLSGDGLVPPGRPSGPARSPGAPPAAKKGGKAKPKQKRKAAQASRKANQAKKKRK